MASTAPLRWWTEETLAVVTGGNKGIGFEIVQKLASEGILVVLAARDEGRGLKATEELHAKDLKNVVFRKLDIGIPESVNAFADWIKHTYGGLDILINNASVLHFNCAEYKDVKESIDVNYRGTVNLTEKLLPIMRSSAAGARIVNVSSRVAQLINVKDESLREKLNDPTKFDEEFLDNVAKNYEDARKAGSKAADGYGLHPYGLHPYSVSKVLLSAYSRLLAQRVADRPDGQKIYVNDVHPGMVNTGMYLEFRKLMGDDLIAHKQSIGEFPELSTVEQGADTPVWLALMPAGGPSGKFFNKRKEFSYYGDIPVPPDFS